ncbi:MAG: bi-domain-containing oxidoreductase [Bacteriovoracaceae bacterium]|nr:bi-domain-containing oxidoreductase [Bacteriovoracaceae bacterium]
MKQILQNLKTGETSLAEVPVPLVKTGHLLIRSNKTLISLGTERMLLEFGKAGWINKARQQPDKVKQVLEKIQTDGLKPTLTTVLNKLDQPLCLGYCNVGTVVEIGKGVKGYEFGDRVVSNGKHAEVVCVPVNICAKSHDGVDDTTAVFCVLGSIALQGIRLISPSLGETFVVHGLGLVGLLTTQILLANGCQVIGFDLDPEKVSIARGYGADAYLIDRNMDPVSFALEANKGVGVDGVLICAATKSNDPIHQATQMCRKRGRVVLVGVVGLELSRADFYKKEISFQVSCSYGPGRYETKYEEGGLDYPIGFVRWTEQRNFEAVLQLMAKGKIKTDKLITEIVPLDRAPEKYTQLDKESGLGYLVDYPGKPIIEERVVKLNTRSKIAYQEPVVGFIGAGNYASKVLIPAFKKTGIRFKSIASMSGVSGYHQGKKFGFELTTTDCDSIFTDSDINIVVIATKHNTHARFIIAALKANKHVFVEKPLCINQEELSLIEKTYNETQATHNLKLMVGFNRRFAPLIQKTKKLLDDMPEPKCFIITVNAGFIPADHWTQDMDIGGGRIIGEGCHFIDLLRFLSKHPIEEVLSIKMKDSSAIDITSDNTSISLRFKDGSIGTVHYFSNGSKSFPKERLEVFCGRRILCLDNFHTLMGYGWKGFRKAKLWAQDKGHENCINAFVKAVKDGESSPVPLDEIIEVAGKCLKLEGL